MSSSSLHPRAAAGDDIPARPLIRTPLRNRFTWFLALLIFATFATRLVWGWTSDRLYNKALDDLRARGEPATLDEVRYAPISGPNALDLYKQAEAFKVIDTPRMTSDEFGPYPNRGAKWRTTCQLSEMANAGLFALAHQARGKQVRYRDKLLPYIVQLLNYVKLLRDVANGLADGAEYVRRFNGDDALCLERILDMRHISRCLYQDDQLVSYMVGVGIDTMAANVIEETAPEIDFRKRFGKANPARAAAMQLIKEMLAAEAEARAGRARAFSGDRLSFVDITLQTSKGDWLLAPMDLRAAARLSACYDAAIAASQATRFGDFQNAFKADPRAQLYREINSGGREIWKMWFRYLLQVNSVLIRSFRVVADQRMAVISLAIALYRADHSGVFPAKLDDLVPAYLPSVPEDPFAAAPQPIGYVTIKDGVAPGVDRPMLFDVEFARDLGPPPAANYEFEGYRDNPTGPTIMEFRQYRDLLPGGAFPSKP